MTEKLYNTVGQHYTKPNSWRNVQYQGGKITKTIMEENRELLLVAHITLLEISCHGSKKPAFNRYAYYFLVVIYEILILIVSMIFLRVARHSFTAVSQ